MIAWVVGGIFTVVFLLSRSSPLLWAQESEGSKPADIILHHAKVLTVDDNYTVAEAMAITETIQPRLTVVGGRIVLCIPPLRTKIS